MNYKILPTGATDTFVIVGKNKPSFQAPKDGPALFNFLMTQLSIFSKLAPEAVASTILRSLNSPPLKGKLAGLSDLTILETLMGPESIGKLAQAVVENGAKPGRLFIDAARLEGYGPTGSQMTTLINGILKLADLRSVSIESSFVDGTVLDAVLSRLPTALTRLGVASNTMTGSSDVGVVVEAIGRFSHLAVLSFFGNLQMTSAQFVALSRALPETMTQFSVYGFEEGFGIGPKDLEALGGRIHDRDLPHLTQLVLPSSWKVTGSDNQFVDISAFLTQLKGSPVVKLGVGNVNKESVGQIAAQFEEGFGISAGPQRLSKDAFELLVKQLPCSTAKMSSFYVSGIDLTGIGDRPIEDLVAKLQLFSSTSTMSPTFGIEAANLSDEHGALMVRTLRQAIVQHQGKTDYHYLGFQGNKGIGSASGSKTVSGIANLLSTTNFQAAQLDLSGCQLSNQDVATLGEAIEGRSKPDQPKVAGLTLRDNVTLTDVSALATSLAKADTVTEALNLSAGQPNKALAAVVIKNLTPVLTSPVGKGQVQSVNLSGLGLGDQQMKELATIIQGAGEGPYNPIEIIISDPDITDDGLNAISEAIISLGGNTHIRVNVSDLLVNNTQFSAIAYQRFVTALSAQADYVLGQLDQSKGNGANTGNCTVL